MASGSELHKWKYDVFLSFSGEDTRTNFTSHLYYALCQKGVHTFIDHKELKRGEKIYPGLLRAIEDSRISIVVISKTYASSASCLEELVKILEVNKSKGQIILPVFYNVNPSEIRGLKASFGEALAKHEQKFGLDFVHMAKAALRQVASFYGWHLGNGFESKFIQRIVEEVLSKLNRTPLNVAKHPVGLDSPMEDIKSLLNLISDDVDILGIYGIGGIGKTTLAKAVYTLVANQFEGSTFIANVREISQQRFGLLQLQETLLSDILKSGDLKIRNVDRGINLIKSRLSCKRVLVVLDDVDSLEQVELLVGDCSWFGSGSRIIITTRDEHLLIANNVKIAYKVKELSQAHALELFSWYAFKKPCPPTNYEKLSSNILSYAMGMPLALTVLGSYLSGRSLAEWRSALRKLKKIPNKQIYQVLKISFDGLEENEKSIFLDIACFFKGKDKEYVKKILEGCDLYPDNGIGVLVEKSLITIELNKIWMHDLLQEMAKEIIRNESPREPGQRSRIWFHEDVLHVLNENTGTDNIEGIKIDLPEPDKVMDLAKALAKMKKLRLLMVYNENISDEIQYLSNELRLIDWPGFPSSTLPKNFHPKRLVTLNLSNSRIKHLWKGVKVFKDLKLVSFNCCEFLSEIPDFSMVPNLESLNLDHCTNLVKLHESVGSLDKLVTLSLQFCTNLSILPSCFKLRSLRTLSFTGCCKLIKFPDIDEKMEHLIEILLHGTAIKELPESIEHLIGLRFLFLDFCRKLENLPSNLHKLQFLTDLDLTGCSKLRELPKLPLNIRCIEASNCISLERIPQLTSPSSFSQEDSERFYEMRFINCHKLINKQAQDQILSRLLSQESHWEAAFPGSKVPDWFDYHSTNGSISLQVSSRLYGKPVDCYFGAVVELDKAAKATGLLSCGYDVIINDHRTWLVEKYLGSLESSHLWLTKIKFSNFTWILNSTSMQYWNKFEVVFWISQVSSKEKVKATLKSCGLHIICKQQGYQIDQTLVRKCVG